MEPLIRAIALRLSHVSGIMSRCGATTNVDDNSAKLVYAQSFVAEGKVENLREGDALGNLRTATPLHTHSFPSEVSISETAPPTKGHNSTEHTATAKRKSLQLNHER